MASVASMLSQVRLFLVANQSDRFLNKALYEAARKRGVNSPVRNLWSDARQYWFTSCIRTRARHVHAEVTLYISCFWQYVLDE